jgi:hypothetical protein
MHVSVAPRLKWPITKVQIRVQGLREDLLKAKTKRPSGTFRYVGWYMLRAKARRRRHQITSTLRLWGPATNLPQNCLVYDYQKRADRGTAKTLEVLGSGRR